MAGDSISAEIGYFRDSISADSVTRGVTLDRVPPRRIANCKLPQHFLSITGKLPQHSGKLPQHSDKLPQHFLSITGKLPQHSGYLRDGGGQGAAADPISADLEMRGGG
jgi:hypothetical protein